MQYFCDESCYLQSTDDRFMVIGTVYCTKTAAKKANKAIKAIKAKHNIEQTVEKPRFASKSGLNLCQIMPLHRNHAQ